MQAVRFNTNAAAYDDRLSRDRSSNSAARPWGARGLGLPEPLEPVNIAGVSSATNLFLAPMSGVTDSAFRRLVRTCSGEALGLVVTEFVAAEGLGRGNRRTLAMLRFKQSERPLSVQIFGADPGRMAEAAAMVADSGADILDLNCGCPAPKVVKRGGGAELMRNPRRLRDILRAMVSRVDIPVTVKLRSGWNDDSLNAVEIARMVEDEGAAMVTVHGRTREAMYRGPADWELVARIRAAATIPVAGSGDAGDPEAALGRLRGGWADAVMIGRAALANPWVFAQIYDLASGRSPRVVRPEHRTAALATFHRFLAETLPEKALLGRLKGMACRLSRGRAKSAAARRRIGEAGDAAAVLALFADLMESSLAETEAVELVAQNRPAPGATP